MAKQSQVTLDRDEYVVIKSDRVRRETGSFWGGSFSDELTLTNKRLIHIKKNFWGSRDAMVIGLASIKVLNGACQVRLEKSEIGSHWVTFYLYDGEETFCFESKVTAMKFVSETSRVLTGVSVFPSILNDVDPAVATVATALADGVSSVATAFGVDLKLDQFMPKQPPVKTVACATCGGDVHGPEGAVATCTCCGAKTRL